MGRPMGRPVDRSVGRSAVTTVRARDGVPIAVHDLGGEGESLVLAHGTGLHGRVWEPVAEAVGEDLHRLSFDAREHGDSGPSPGPTIDWRGFGLDVLAVVEVWGGRPWGAGHSAGATALLLAEQARPGTFRGLYCYEPVLVAADPPLGPDPDSWLAAATRKRRDGFASRDEAYDHYRSTHWVSVAPAVLRAFVDHGLRDLADGTVALKCRPEREAMIYEMGTAHDAYPRLGDVRCPVALVRGELTDALGPGALEDVATHLHRAQIEVVTGVGHLGPMEAPEAVASSIRSFVESHRGVTREPGS